MDNVPIGMLARNFDIVENPKIKKGIEMSVN